MNAVEKMYQRWEGYIADAEMNDQFREDCLEAEQQIKELKKDLRNAISFGDYVNYPSELNIIKDKQALK